MQVVLLSQFHWLTERDLSLRGDLTAGLALLDLLPTGERDKDRDGDLEWCFGLGAGE